MSTRAERRDVRITVNLPEETVKTLEKMARDRGLSMTDVLIQAIANQHFIDNETAAGKVIFMERKGGQTEQVIFR